MSSATAAVSRTIIVEASVETTFAVFTDDIDSWWPRTHHIGKADMVRIVIEGCVGGRCCTEHVDGSQCCWGRVLAWEPPRRLLLAWQITSDWGYQPDLSRCSEVEATFESLADGCTRVSVEHRRFERHGESGTSMRNAVDAPNGWTRVLSKFVERMSK